MSTRANLATLAGEWTGTNQLWLSPGEPVRESAVTASLTLAVRGAFGVLTYAWTESGKPHEGLLLFPLDFEASGAEVVWVDSWHTAGKLMMMRAEVPGDDDLSAHGSYAAPPGPDWGWRIALRADGADALRMTMYNIPPGEDEVLAVEAKLRRVGAGGRVGGDRGG